MRTCLNLYELISQLVLCNALIVADLFGGSFYSVAKCFRRTAI